MRDWGMVGGDKAPAGFIAKPPGPPGNLLPPANPSA